MIDRKKLRGTIEALRRIEIDATLRDIWVAPGSVGAAVDEFHKAASPAVVLALLDELAARDARIEKLRENDGIALSGGSLARNLLNREQYDPEGLRILVDLFDHIVRTFAADAEAAKSTDPVPSDARPEIKPVWYYDEACSDDFTLQNAIEDVADGYPVREIAEVVPLAELPHKFAVWLDDHNLKLFDSVQAARAAIKAADDEAAKG